LKNIEETEAAKKLLQEKRLMVGRTKSDFSIPSSYSADYFQRGRDYAEKLRKGNIFLDSFIIDYTCSCFLEIRIYIIRTTQLFFCRNTHLRSVLTK
jgi:hypothetical protein